MPLYRFSKQESRAVSLAQEILLSDVDELFEAPLDAELVHFRFRRVETVLDFGDYDVVSIAIVGQWEEPGGASPFPGTLRFQLQRFKVFADASRVAVAGREFRTIPNEILVLERT